MTTSLTNDLEKNYTINDKLQDINFTEIPYNFSNNDSTLDGPSNRLNFTNLLRGVNKNRNEFVNESTSIGLQSNIEGGLGFSNPSLKIKRSIPIPIQQAIDLQRLN